MPALRNVRSASLQNIVRNIRKNRRKAGKKHEREYVTLDLETTGLEPAKDRIIEIGAVKVMDGTVTEEYATLVNPREKDTGENYRTDRHFR